MSLQALEPGLVWLVAGLLLMLGEIFAPGAFLVWLGLAAIGTGLVVLAAAPAFALQVVVFGVLAAGCIALGLRLRGRRRAPVLNTAGAGLVGRHARVLAFDGAEGRVRVGDSDWPARLAHGTPHPDADALLLVVAVDGVMLVVGPAR